jgi:transcriptional regulator with XRE-family HTH domain
LKLSKKDKLEICRLFYSGEKTKAELAKKFGVSHTAISKILNADKVAESFKSLGDETIEENALSMIAYLDSKKQIAQHLITVALDGVEEKIKRASLKDTINAIEKLSTVFKDHNPNGQTDDDIQKSEKQHEQLKAALEDRIIEGFNDGEDEV